MHTRLLYSGIFFIAGIFVSGRPIPQVPNLSCLEKYSRLPLDISDSVQHHYHHDAIICAQPRESYLDASDSEYSEATSLSSDSDFSALTSSASSSFFQGPPADDEGNGYDYFNGTPDPASIPLPPADEGEEADLSSPWDIANLPLPPQTEAEKIELAHPNENARVVVEVLDAPLPPDFVKPVPGGFPIDKPSWEVDGPTDQCPPSLPENSESWMSWLSKHWSKLTDKGKAAFNFFWNKAGGSYEALKDTVSQYYSRFKDGTTDLVHRGRQSLAERLNRIGEYFSGKTTTVHTQPAHLTPLSPLPVEHQSHDTITIPVPTFTRTFNPATTTVLVPESPHEALARESAAAEHRRLSDMFWQHVGNDLTVNYEMPPKPVPLMTDQEKDFINKMMTIREVLPPTEKGYIMAGRWPVPDWTLPAAVYELTHNQEFQERGYVNLPVGSFFSIPAAQQHARNALLAYGYTPMENSDTKPRDAVGMLHLLRIHFKDFSEKNIGRGFDRLLRANGWIKDPSAQKSKQGLIDAAAARELFHQDGLLYSNHLHEQGIITRYAQPMTAEMIEERKRKDLLQMAEEEALRQKVEDGIKQKGKGWWEWIVEKVVGRGGRKEAERSAGVDAHPSEVEQGQEALENGEIQPIRVEEHEDTILIPFSTHGYARPSSATQPNPDPAHEEVFISPKLKSLVWNPRWHVCDIEKTICPEEDLHERVLGWQKGVFEGFGGKGVEISKEEGDGEILYIKVPKEMWDKVARKES